MSGDGYHITTSRWYEHRYGGFEYGKYIDEINYINAHGISTLSR